MRDDSVLQQGRARLGQVFGYLEALNELCNPVTRSIGEQPWSFWLRDLPDHPSIRRGMMRDATADAPSDDLVLSVKRPQLTLGPALPDEIVDWVIVQRDEPDSRVEIRES